jgi:GNAT superfamily N-acetyltransferase
MLDTISEKPKPARIYVDDIEKPEFCIVSYHHLLFIGGQLTQQCLDYLSNDILTTEFRSSNPIVFMIYPNEAWGNALKELFAGNCNQYERSLYSCKPEAINGLSSVESIFEVTSELMKSNTENLGMIIEEVVSTGTYDDMEDYLYRGIGYTPIIDNKVCGFCTSEYPSKDAVAIGIEVIEEYQRKGYAKTMAKAFLFKAAQRSLKVYWECWKNNLASANTALACGFEKVSDYPILFVRL